MRDYDTLQRARAEFLSLRFGMFIHYNMATYHGVEWVDPGQSPLTFNPGALDCEQWAAAATSARMRYAVLTVKHHDGFCLWDSAVSAYSVAASPLAGRDIVREYCDAFRRNGVEPHLYFSIWDRTLGIEGTITERDVLLIEAQLRELLTGYGQIRSITFDGFGNCGTEFDGKVLRRLQDYAQSIQPAVLIADHFQTTRKMRLEDLYQFSDFLHFEEAPPVGITAPVGNLLAGQQGPTIQREWFWKPDFPGLEPMSVADIKRRLDVLADRSCNLLLNVSPNRDGLLDEIVRRRLQEVGEAIDDDGGLATRR